MKNEAKFYLEKRKDKETGKVITTNVPIFMFFSYEGKRLQYFTGYRVDAFKWDENSMKARKGFSESAQLNSELTKLKFKAEGIFEKAKVLGEHLSIEEFRDQLKDREITPKGKKSFVECLAEYQTVSSLTKGESTLKNIKSGFKTIVEFSKEAGIKLEFRNITQEFYDAFLDYCFTEKKFKNSHTGKLIKDLKAFLNWATDRGYNTNLDFKKKSFKKLTEEPEIIYLTYEELMKLYKYDLKGNTRLQQVRDIFCFGCFTGMRYSDIVGLSPENIHGDVIQYRVIKTTQNNTVPLNPFSKALIDKYKDKISNRCFPVISQQKINTYLKELFGVVELNRKVEIVHFQGAKRISVTAPLCEVITFHMSKKTFMTNFLAKGGSLLTAMAITGNKDFKTAKRYFKVVDTLKAEEMAKVFGKAPAAKKSIAR